MGKRTDIHRILVIGAGPIVIGQACEFDYAGSQACKALQEEGYEVILVNSNPATMMTDPNMATRTYIEPLTPAIVEKIIAQEKPDAVLPTLGGQTALNLAMALYEKGVFKDHQIKMLGANAQVIRKAEDRTAFKQAMNAIGLASAQSAAAHTLPQAQAIVQSIGFPCVIRPAFTLGGTGGGIAYNENALKEIVATGLQQSPTSVVLIEASLIGWKEYELEVMRDKKDNVVIVCAIENLDPMGVHTGDSITVAPAQTLTDKEYQKMRNATIAIMRTIGVETGGANVQFAVNPKNGDMVVIEMNPRVSRSSALASKATGFPIAKLAAKLAVGYTLDELQNDITQKTPACFEPAIDYVVSKLPRFNFEKFENTPPVLGTAMQSVGEAMAIGRTFKESLQKGIRSLELQRFGLGFDGKDMEKMALEAIVEKLKIPNPERLFYIKQAFEQGMTLMQIHEHTKIDPWFLHQLQQIVAAPKNFTDTYEDILAAKQMGFSDCQLAYILHYPNEEAFRARRKALGIGPVYKCVDTCAGEFEAYTPYYYATYEQEDEVRVTCRPKVMLLGSGPNRIGQGIEFDYCCVHAAMAAKAMGYETIMVNANPETVSTDFTSSDKLYFEPLTFEDVLNIYEKEQPKGVMLQFGGQTPLNLAEALTQAGVNILGTAFEYIDLAENRKRFSQLLRQLHLQQPRNAFVTHGQTALAAAQRIGYPVVVRPSYVIGGAAMQICFDAVDLQQYMQKTPNFSVKHPLLIDQYIAQAIEVDVDALADGNDCVIAGIMQHIEPTGIHSGDSACVLPPYALPKAMITKIRQATQVLAKALHIVGLCNLQFAIKGDALHVIEVNPRASRTIPFVSKATGVPWADKATQVILGKTLAELGIKEVIPTYHSVKEAVFPFEKFPHVDPIRTLAMRATGEVMGIDADFHMAYYKAQLAAHTGMDMEKGLVCFHISQNHLELYVPVIKNYQALGFKVVTTMDVADTMGMQHQMVVHDALTTITWLEQGKIRLLISHPTVCPGQQELQIRQTALRKNIPIVTSLEAAQHLAEALKSVQHKQITVKALQDYYPQPA